jgi:hypothetical protein
LTQFFSEVGELYAGCSRPLGTGSTGSYAYESNGIDYANANASGIAEARAQTRWQDTITNTLSVAAAPVVTFNMRPGSVSAGANGTIDATESASAQVMLSLFADGMLAGQGTASVLLNNTGALNNSLVNGGIAIPGTASGAQIGWGAFSFTHTFAALNPGASVLVEYVVDSLSVSNFLPETYSSGCYGDGYGGDLAFSSFSDESGYGGDCTAVAVVERQENLQPNYSALEQLLQALKQAGDAVVAHVPGLAEKLAREHECATLALSRQPLDMSAVGASCDAGVCHSPGTARELLRHGKPVLLLPRQVEQEMVAKRLEARLGSRTTRLGATPAFQETAGKAAERTQAA